MGSPISKLFDSFLGKTETRILMLGLCAAGKSTILHKIRLGKIVYSTPRTFFDIETVQYKKIKLTCWDIIGASKLRPMWRTYFQDTQGFIFVVDSLDREQIKNAKEELHWVLSNEELKDAALLVLANKQDLDAMSVAEITEKLGLHTLQGRDWYVQGTCTTSDNGLYEGFEWLCKTIAKRK